MALVVAGVAVVTSLSCLEAMFANFVTGSGCGFYPKVVITHPVTERVFTTTEATALICGICRTKKPKVFLFDVVVTNRANDYRIVVSAINTHEASKQTVWCTSEDVPLETGKNRIYVDSNPGCQSDRIVIIREVE